ncbi:MAG: hypothetical protein FWE33_07200 [Defluviitaleaceae bacterium]|nr:hypothetical protein [Defluviitaleaceae bacterium]
MDFVDIASIVSSGAVVLGAIVAFVSYIKHNSEKRKTAATLLLLQIDDVDETILTLKELQSKGKFDAEALLNLPTIECNAWDEGKHLLLRKLNATDRRVLEQYFLTVNNIKKSLDKLVGMFTMNWNARTLFASSTFAELARENMDDATRVDSAISNFWENYARIDDVYSPSILENALISNLTICDAMLGKTTYEKIKKMSYVKD